MQKEEDVEFKIRVWDANAHVKRGTLEKTEILMKDNPYTQKKTTHTFSCQQETAQPIPFLALSDLGKGIWLPNTN